MKRKARSHLRNIRNNRLRNIRNNRLRNIGNNRLRNIGNNRLRNNNVITQGDTNIYMSDRPAQAAIHVIAYPPNEDFIKRPDIVDKLDQLLPRSSGYHSAALCGLGGTGKTQIALDYIYRQCGTRSVFWVHADTKATIINDYKTIAKKLGIMDEQLDDEALLMAVCSRIEEEPEWLLVLDNADDLSLFGVGPASTSSKSLPNCVPRGPKGVVLWTSRDKRIMGTLVSPLRVIEVGDMSLEEAKKLLALATATIQTEASSEDTKDIDKLLENLQYHALAISQAGAYMRRTSTPVRDYLAMLSKKQKRQKLLEKSEFDRHRKSGAPNSILDTWSISIRRIQQESEQAFHLFHIMVYFDCQSIPESLVEIVGIGCHLKDDELKEAITRLGEFYLIYQRKDEHGCAIYEIHKLVQEAARYGLRRRNLLDKGLTTINISDVPREREEDSEDSEETYYAMYALYIMGFLSEKLQETGQTWALGDAYLTHVLQIVEWMDIFEEKVIVLTDLLLVAGLLGRLRRWKDKELLVKRALTMTRKMLGEEHPDTMKCMHALAISYLGQAFGLRDTGPLQFDFDSWFKGAQELCGEAEKIGKQLVKLGRKISEPTDREKIASLKLMADVYCGQEKYNKAKVFTRRILRLQWKEHGLKHPSTLTAMEDLARVFYFHDTPGLRKRALRVREKILEFQKETTGEKTPTTIYAMYNLATSLKRCGRLRDAITLMNQCCRLSKEVFVGGHDMIFECRWLAAYWRLELSKDDKDGIQ